MSLPCVSRCRCLVSRTRFPTPVISPGTRSIDRLANGCSCSCCWRRSHYPMLLSSGRFRDANPIPWSSYRSSRGLDRVCRIRTIVTPRTPVFRPSVSHNRDPNQSRPLCMALTRSSWIIWSAFSALVAKHLFHTTASYRACSCSYRVTRSPESRLE